jgi:coproporphyrinogen III oxidase
MTTTVLPSHRQLLSSLITAVSQPPPQSSTPLPQNPTLKASIPPSRRQFLLTLHVLFPTLLLPALDLLDRELITCLITDQEQESSRRDRIYVVKSLASTLRGAQRRGVAKQAPEGRYVVRLTAWNCSCASFALEAYGGSSRPGSSEAKAQGETAQRDVLFGGLSLEEANVPCCKHLLACLLADNWEAVLGGRIESRHVTREELAGIIASV